MRNFKAIILLFTVAAISAATVFYGGVTFAFSDTFVSASSTATAAKPQENVIIVDALIETDTVSSAPSSEKAESQSIAVSENHTVNGKIISTTINPKSAAASYGGVYLKNSSGAKIDIKTELAAGSKIKLKKSAEPQVLIMHTHTTESYIMENRDYYTKEDASRSTDNRKNMVAIGDIIAEKVEAAEEAGAKLIVIGRAVEEQGKGFVEIVEDLRKNFAGK